MGSIGLLPNHEDNGRKRKLTELCPCCGDLVHDGDYRRWSIAVTGCGRNCNIPSLDLKREEKKNDYGRKGGIRSSQP